jgi:hypothetical protein
VAAVHGDVVDVHVHKQVTLGDTAVDRHLLALFGLSNAYVVLLVLGVVVVEAIRVVTGHDLLTQAMAQFALCHPAVQAKSGDDMYVLDALRVSLFEDLFDHELPRVWPLHRR